MKCVKTMLGVIAVMMATMTVAAPATAADPIVGVWQTRVKSQITIKTCGASYCGYVSKVVAPLAQATSNLTDVHNKDANLRARPVLGLQVLALRTSTKPGVFDGEIYNPEDGNTYSGYLEVKGPDNVKVTGCMLSILCKGEDWVRVGR